MKYVEGFCRAACSAFSHRIAPCNAAHPNGVSPNGPAGERSSRLWCAQPLHVCRSKCNPLASQDAPVSRLRTSPFSENKSQFKSALFGYLHTFQNPERFAGANRSAVHPKYTRITRAIYRLKRKGIQFSDGRNCAAEGPAQKQRGNRKEARKPCEKKSGGEQMARRRFGNGLARELEGQFQPELEHAR